MARCPHIAVVHILPRTLYLIMDHRGNLYKIIFRKRIPAIIRYIQCHSAFAESGEENIFHEEAKSKCTSIFLLCVQSRPFTLHFDLS